MRKERILRGKEMSEWRLETCCDDDVYEFWVLMSTVRAKDIREILEKSSMCSVGENLMSLARDLRG